MRGVGIIFVLIIVLTSTLSLSLQTVYKNHFCQDTKEYMSLVGKSITVCGKTCDFDFVGAPKADVDTNFTFNYSAPPLYFEAVETISLGTISLYSAVTDNKYEDYSFLYARECIKPPRLIS